MTEECKTVTSSDAELLDPLYMKQQQDVAEMRASLLAFNSGNPNSARSAIQKITAMRFYHQLSRIIRYTDMMDKIEAKLYESIDRSLENMNSNSPSTWMSLLTIQERLQKCMIESQKLLEPYLDLESLSFVEVPASTDDVSYGALMMEQQSRDKLRNSAQAVLSAISDNKEVSSVQSADQAGDEDE